MSSREFKRRVQDILSEISFIEQSRRLGERSETQLHPCCHWVSLPPLNLPFTVTSGQLALRQAQCRLVADWCWVSLPAPNLRFR